jgi:hypothetical protein
LGQSLQVRGRGSWACFSSLFSCCRSCRPLQIGGRVINQAARRLRDALHRVDDQGDALAQQVEALEAQVDDEHRQRNGDVESQKGQRCWPSLEERWWRVVDAGHRSILRNATVKA